MYVPPSDSEESEGEGPWRWEVPADPRGRASDDGGPDREWVEQDPWQVHPDFWADWPAFRRLRQKGSEVVVVERSPKGVTKGAKEWRAWLGKGPPVYSPRGKEEEEFTVRLGFEEHWVLCPSCNRWVPSSEVEGPKGFKVCAEGATACLRRMMKEGDDARILRGCRALRWIWRWDGPRQHAVRDLGVVDDFLDRVSAFVVEEEREPRLREVLRRRGLKHDGEELTQRQK